MRRWIVAGFASAFVFASVAFGQNPDVHPRVIGFDRFYADEKSDAVEAGQLLLGELNCVSCHRPADGHERTIVKKQAPVLTELGQRARPGYFAKFLANPQATKPGTTMPHVFAGLPEEKAKENALAIAHFLATTGQSEDKAPLFGAVMRGEKLFHEAGCVACHDARVDGAEPLATSIPIGTPSRKYTFDGLAKFLADPLHVRPSGRMPNMNLGEGGARDVAAYLLKDIQGESGLSYQYYEGNWNDLPDLNKEKPVAVGDATGFNFDMVKRRDQFAVRYDGKIALPKEGKWKFHLTSDDGSRMSIDGKEIIRIPGVHPPIHTEKVVELAAGEHVVSIEFFEQGGGEELYVDYEGPDTPRRKLEEALVQPKAKPADPNAKPFVADAGLAAKGRELFVSSGCASCHELKVDGKALEPQLAAGLVAKPLAELKPVGGCLSENPSAKAPWFALNARQRQTVAAAIGAVAKKPAELAPANVVHRNMARMACYACHQRGVIDAEPGTEIGGVEDERQVHFAAEMKEMGDEGKLPPVLTSVGAKLQEGWFKEVLEKGTKVRPYMYAHMPQFGAGNLAGLQDAFVGADMPLQQRRPALEAADDDKKLKAAGRKLLGSTGLSCVKCHAYAGKATPGIRAMDMSTMAKRVRPDWFHHYLIDPQRFRPRTRMPTAWPEGKSVAPKILAGDTPLQIRAIWNYLLDGEQAILPDGLVVGAIELVADKEAVMYRNFIDGAGPRAIGVGYPERVNLAFDANHQRLALLWNGGFIDAAKHWEGRGPGYQSPLGDNVLRLPDERGFARLDSLSQEWPKSPNQNEKVPELKFGGYKLDELRRPIFRYDLGDVRIDDAPMPKTADDVTTFERTLTLSTKGAPTDVVYLAAAGAIEELGDNRWRIDNRYVVTIRSSKPPVLRESRGRKELLVPVEFKDGKATIVQEYEW